MCFCFPGVAEPLLGSHRVLSLVSLCIWGPKLCLLLKQEGKCLSSMERAQGKRWDWERWENRVRMGTFLAAPCPLSADTEISRDLTQLSSCFQHQEALGKSDFLELLPFAAQWAKPWSSLHLSSFFLAAR